MVTDFDCWHPDHDHVTVEMIVRTLVANASHARALVREVAPRVVQPAATPCPCGCQRALEHALITAPAARDPMLAGRLAAVAGRVLAR
jgi:5'-methylthioadenosine phosphorylase